MSAPTVLARLFELPQQAPTSDIEKADALRADAESAAAEAEAIAVEIAGLDASLPIRQARERTAPLIDAQERALRRALQFIEEALAIFPSPAEPSEPQSQTTVDASDRDFGPAEDVVPVPPSSTVETASEPDEEADLRFEATEEEAPEDEIEVAPIIPIVEPERAEPAPSDPLRDEVEARLDRLFSTGEFGLAFHLSSAVLKMMPQASDAYTPIELRLAAAGGRTVGLSSQDLGLLANQEAKRFPSPSRSKVWTTTGRWPVCRFSSSAPCQRHCSGPTTWPPCCWSNALAASRASSIFRSWFRWSRRTGN